MKTGGEQKRQRTDELSAFSFAVYNGIPLNMKEE